MIKARDIHGDEMSNADRKFDVFHVSDENLHKLLTNLGHSVFVDLEPEFGEDWLIWLPYDPTDIENDLMQECYAYSSSELPDDWTYVVKD